MLKHDKTTKSSEKHRRMYDFLKTHPVGVLSSVDPNNEPHASVIYFSVDESLDIMFTTKSKTKKVSNLNHNKHCMLLVYDQSEQVTAQVTAVAEEIHDEDQVVRAIRATIRTSMKTSEAGIPPIVKLSAGDFLAFRLRPVQVRMAVYNRPDPGGYDEVFEVIDF